MHLPGTAQLGATIGDTDIFNKLTHENTKNEYSLSTFASVLPDIPVALNTGLLASLSDFSASNTLIVTVVPLPNIFGDLNPGIALQSGAVRLWSVGIPWQRALDAEVQQLKRLLGSLSGRNIAV